MNKWQSWQKELQDLGFWRKYVNMNMLCTYCQESGEKGNKVKHLSEYMSQDLHSDNGVFPSIISEPLDELSKFTFEDTKVEYSNFFQWSSCSD